MNPPNLPEHENKSEDPSVAITNFATALEALLRDPTSLLSAARARPTLLAPFGLLILVCLVVFGLVLGSFSGGHQFWAVPLKSVGGYLIAAAICFPSFYIFSCLANAPLQLRGLSAIYLCFLALLSLLLIAFAPVLWIFAQSSGSVTFVGALSLLIWVISFALAASILKKSAGEKSTWQVHLWLLIFLTVSLQMSTAVRPLLGPAETFPPSEKRFFLAHWGQSFQDEVSVESDIRSEESRNPKTRNE
jgi:hypothetical protein